MKVLAIANVSNVDDLQSDSGLTFQRILAKEFAAFGIDYKLLVPIGIKDCLGKIEGADVIEVPMGTTRYESRFAFDWPAYSRIIRETSPDVVFNSQAELAAPLKGLMQTNGLDAKLITYCHYPGLWEKSAGRPTVDSTLDHGGLGYHIVQSIISANRVSDAFLIQSQFASNLIYNAGEYFRAPDLKNIDIIAPPCDPSMNAFVETTDRNPGREDKKIIYNHRLYESYGTQTLIDYIDACSELNLKYFISDPMGNRSKQRASLSGSPGFFRSELERRPCIEMSPRQFTREEYRQNVQSSRVGIAAFRPACVWSLSALDCMGLGTPVIAPRYASYPEFIPNDLLFTDVSGFKELLIKLTSDQDFWIDASSRCLDIASQFNAADIAQKIYKIFSR